MDLVKRLYRLLLQHRFQLTDHAIESMDEDDIDLRDLGCCLQTGSLRRSWPQEAKYEITGLATDGRHVRVVARLTEEGDLRIITVYEIH